MRASHSHHFMSELKATRNLTVDELSKAHHKTCQATDEGQLQTDFFRYAQSPEELCHEANLQTHTRPLTPQFQRVSASSIPFPRSISTKSMCLLWQCQQINRQLLCDPFRLSRENLLSQQAVEEGEDCALTHLVLSCVLRSLLNCPY